jgi:hypothetical protein
MTISKAVNDQLDYAIHHDPKRYVLGYSFPFHVVRNLEGNTVSFHFWKEAAKVECDLYNAIYSRGYTFGQQSIMKILLKNGL